MNKSAVAMAADSAVTISSGRSGIKTYDTMNKLFELIKGRPVGVMVYANAELNGVPWETVIKCYRESRAGFHFKQLDDYASDFLAYLLSSGYPLSTESDEYSAFNMAYNALLRISNAITQDFSTCVTKTGRVVKARLSRL